MNFEKPWQGEFPTGVSAARAIRILDVACEEVSGWNGPTHCGSTPEQWRDDLNMIVRELRPEVSHRIGFLVADAVKAAYLGDSEDCEEKLCEAANLFVEGQ